LINLSLLLSYFLGLFVCLFPGSSEVSNCIDKQTRAKGVLEGREKKTVSPSAAMYIE
jgi:hypothetical protein